MAVNTRTTQIIDSLEEAFASENFEAVLTGLNLLREQFVDVSEIDAAVCDGVLDLLGQLIWARDRRLKEAAASLVENAVSSLVNSGEPALWHSRSVQLSKFLLKFLRDKVSDAEHSFLSELVSRTMLRASEGSHNFKKVLLDIFPPSRWKTFKYIDCPRTSLDNLTDIIINLRAGDDDPRLVNIQEALEVFSLIVGKLSIACQTVRKICSCVRQILEVENPRPLLELIERTQLLNGFVQHMTTAVHSICEGECLAEFLELLPALITPDRELTLKFVSRGLLGVVKEALCGDGSDRAILNGLRIIQDCIGCGPKLVEVFSDAELLRSLLSLLTHADARIRFKARSLFAHFLQVVTPDNLLCALGNEVMERFSVIILNHDDSVQCLALTLLERTLDTATLLNEETFIKVAMEANFVPLSLMSLSLSSHKEVRKLAKSLRTRIAPPSRVPPD